MKYPMRPGTECPSLAEMLREHTVVVPDFPRAPIAFIDVTAVLSRPKINHLACQALGNLYFQDDYDVIVALEARAWPFAQFVALHYGKPWYPIRKPGKLPRQVVRQEYACEYGTGILELHMGDVPAGSRVLIIDDVIATGGSAQATIELLQQVKATAVGIATLYSLDYLVDPSLAELCEIRSVVHYQAEPTVHN